MPVGARRGRRDRPPLPGPALVTKNVMLFCCADAAPLTPSASSAAATPVQRLTVLFIERPPGWPFSCAPHACGLRFIINLRTGERIPEPYTSSRLGTFSIQALLSPAWCPPRNRRAPPAPEPSFSRGLGNSVRGVVRRREQRTLLRRHTPARGGAAPAVAGAEHVGPVHLRRDRHRIRRKRTRPRRRTLCAGEKARRRSPGLRRGRLSRCRQAVPSCGISRTAFSRSIA